MGGTPVSGLKSSSLIFLPPTSEGCKGNIFTGMCLSTGDTPFSGSRFIPGVPQNRGTYPQPGQGYPPPIQDRVSVSSKKGYAAGCMPLAFSRRRTFFCLSVPPFKMYFIVFVMLYPGSRAIQMFYNE